MVLFFFNRAVDLTSGGQAPLLFTFEGSAMPSSRRSTLTAYYAQHKVLMQ